MLKTASTASTATVWRTTQARVATWFGFVLMCAGIFLLFPALSHPVAGTMAGIVAVLAPTVGPVVGGWITHHYSWPWVFLVNVIPGVVCAAAIPFLLPRGRSRLNQLRNLDVLSVALMAAALACLEIGLKQAPHS